MSQLGPLYRQITIFLDNLNTPCHTQSMRPIILLMMFGLFFFSVNGYADEHTELVHLAAHVGLSYVIDDVSYRVGNRLLGLRGTSLEVFAAVTTLGVGLVYKFQEQAGAGSTLRSTAENSLGIASALVVRYALKIDLP